MHFKHIPNDKLVLIAVVCCLAAFTSGRLSAQTYYTNSATGNWSASGSWTGSPPPAGGASSAVIVLQPASGTMLATNDLSGTFWVNQVSALANTIGLYGNAILFTNNGATGPLLTNNSGYPLNLYTPITLAANTTFGLANDITNNAVISGVGALTQVGGGTLTLTNLNTYSGNTTVGGGKLRLVAPGSVYSAAYNNTAIVTLTNGAALEFDNYAYGSTYSFGQLDFGSSRIVVNGGTLRSVGATGAYGYRGCNIGTAGGTLDSSVSGQLWTIAYQAGFLPINISGLTTLAGAGNGQIDKQITGTGGVNMTGTGAWTLTSPTNTFSGAITIGAGTLAIGGAGLLGSGAYSAVITNNSLLKYNSSAVQSLSGIISGSGVLVQSGSGTLALSGANTYGGGTTNSAGILEVDNNTALGTGSLTMNGGVLSNSVSSTLTNSVSLSAAGTVGVLSGSTLTLGGVIGGANSLTMAGAGTLTLTNLNTYGGNTTVGGGKLRLVVPGAIYSSAYSTATVTINSGAALEFDNWSYGSTYSFGQLDYGSSRIAVNGGTLRSVAAAGTYGWHGCNIGTAGGTLDSSVSGQLWTIGYQSSYASMSLGGLMTLAGAGNGQIDKQITGTGGVNMTGTGAWTLTSPTNTFSGAITIGAGTLAIGGAGLLGSGAYSAVITNNSLLKYNSSAVQSLSGIISGSGVLVQSGSGTLALSGANTYGGGTTNSAGILEVDNNTALGTGSLTMNGGVLSNSVSSTLTNSVSLSAAGTVGVLSGSTLTLGGVIGGANSLTMAGAGTLTLTNLNTYGGNTTVGGGKLRLVVPGAIYSSAYTASPVVSVTNGAVLEFDNWGYGAGLSFGQLDYGSSRITVNGGTLRSVGTNGVYGGHSLNIGALGGTLDSSVSGKTWTIGTDANAVFLPIAGLMTLTGVGNGEIDKPVTGVGGLMMSGNGTWTLTSSTNTFNGRITISAGTLALSGYGSVSNTPLISVTNGAVFDVSGLTNTFTLQTSQSLSNNAASTGTLKGNLNTASGTISVSYSFGSPAFNVTNGTLTLSASTVFNINNTGTQLGLGNYLIIATNANGLVAGTAPSSVTVGGSGYVAGATVSLAISNSDLYLQVSMPTTTTLTTSITPSVYGQSVTLTTTIAPVSGSTVPTGTVQFKTNGVAMGSPVAVTSGASPNGTAAISTANLPASVSAYLVTAEYAGSGNFLNSTNSPALSQTVNRGTPIVQTTPTAGAISYGQMLSSSTVVGTFTNLSGQAITMGSTNYVTPNLVPNFGTTNVQVYFVPQDTADYYSVTNTVSVSVNQATLTITASNTNKYYGQILTPTGFIAIGLTNGDSVSSATLTSGGATNTATTGSYAIVVTNAMGSGLTNYTISYVAGSLTVNPLAAALSGTRAYDGTTNAAGTNLTVTNVVNGDTVTLGGTGGLASADAGTNVLTSFGTLSLDSGAGTNYTLAGAAGAMIITNTPLTITANNDSKTYDGNAYATNNGVTYAGFVNGETNTDLTGSLTFTGSAQGAVTVGTYTNTPGGYSSADYLISYVSGTLTISQATPVINTPPTASTITYGQTLGDSTLSGGSATPSAGLFTFTASNTVPPVGTAAYGVTYTPTDTTDYTNATTTVSVAVNPAFTPSTNAYLAALVFSPSAGFAPAFTSNVLTGYNATNAYGDTPTVTVTNADAMATNTLIVNGVSLGLLSNEVASIPLTLGVGNTNVVQVQVVSQDLSVTNLYVVDVTLLPPPLSTNALLASLALTPAGNLSPVFDPGTTSYNATNVFTNNPVTVAATSVDANATLALNFNGTGYGSAVTNSLSVSGNTLVLPANTVAVRVVSQDLSQTNTYTVAVLLQPSLTVPKLTNSVSGNNLVLSWPADHLGYRLLVQTNNLNKGVSGNTNDWGTVVGTASVTTTNIAILRVGVTNEYYRLVYP